MISGEENGSACLDARGRGTVVDDVVDHTGIGNGRRDYRTIREVGRNNKYKSITAIQIQYMAIL